MIETLSDLFVVERVPIGRALLPDNKRYDVSATRHNRCWPGTDSPWTFAVERWEQRDRWYGVVAAWGFFEERECYEFLTEHGVKGYAGYTQDGIMTIEARERLGIPDAFVKRF